MDKYNLNSILREYKNIISKMNYIPRITEIRNEYELNQCKIDIINNTNKLSKFIEEHKKDLL